MAKYIDHELNSCDCYCDNNQCGSSELISEVDYNEINRELRSLGWLIKNVNSSWNEFCSNECYEKFISKNTRKDKKEDNWFWN